MEKIKLKRKILSGYAWYKKLLGTNDCLNTPFMWSGSDIQIPELCSIIEEQEKIIEVDTAKYIKENEIPSDFKVIKDWKTIKSGIIK